jgi:Tol biopolymer transport system component
MIAPVRRLGVFILVVVVLAVGGCSGGSSGSPGPSGPAPAHGSLRAESETHFGVITQLTRGQRENAEAYWSSAGDALVFQSNRPPYECDQIFAMPAAGGEARLVSTGSGRTTCAYVLPGDDKVIWSSTHLADPACPPEPDHSQGYVWAVYAGYDIFVSRADGSDARRLTDTPGYDAEATACAADGSIVFTSVRDGDLDLYRMDADGGNVKRLTDAPGYDGGAFFDARCEKLVWRASRPTGEALEDYRRLLGMGLVRPSRLEIYVANADGTEPRQVTYLDAASFGPYFFPSGDRIIFSSNYGDPKGREFELWAVDVDGTRLERITYAPGFDGFPMFSPDGRKLVFGSNRHQKEHGETDIYVAEWVDAAPDAPADAATRDADRVQADVRWLADDARQGRGVGTRGLEDAAVWLFERFEALGFAPRRQTFDVVVSADTGGALAIDGKPVADADWAPSGMSRPANVEGPTVFAGWGIASAALGHDDYARVDAKGKIAVVRRFAPRDGAFADEAVQRRAGDLHEKARAARDRGAIGLIVVDLGDAEEAPFPAPQVERHGDAGIPVAIVKRDVGKRLAKGRHRAALSVRVDKQTRPAHNIVARLDAGAAERLPGAIVIGAHYDHLGLGGEGSLAPGDDEPHNGADDNASGTAALLEVARALAARRAELRRDVWFVAFSGEESGILGSNHFVKAPPEALAIGDVVAMLNMDMVGRLRGNQLQVIGGDSAAEWAEIVDPVCAEQRVQCALGGDGYGPSDQTPFYAAGAPVLHFFTGAHTDYHKPSDDADRINAAGVAATARIVAGVAGRLASREARLTYQSAPAPGPAGDTRSFGASLGTIPDYSDTGEGTPGVLLTGVRPGGPAEQAGMRRGDRIVNMGGADVANLRDMMHVLQNAKPGETTTITVLRDGQRVELRVTYGPSSGRR